MKPRPWATIFVFTLLGPLVGYALAFGPGLVAASYLPKPPGADPAGLAKVWYGLHPMVLMFAYLVGGVPAFLAGVGTVVADRRTRSPGLRYVAASALGAASVIGYFLLLGAKRGVDWRAVSNALPTALLGALSALFCAYLTRRWRYTAA